MPRDVLRHRLLAFRRHFRQYVGRAGVVVPLTVEADGGLVPVLAIRFLRGVVGQACWRDAATSLVLGALQTHDAEAVAAEASLPAGHGPVGTAVEDAEGVDGQHHRQSRQRQHQGDVHTCGQAGWHQVR